MPAITTLPAPCSDYGRLVTFTVVVAGALTCTGGQVGHRRISMLTVDPKVWVWLTPPGGGSGKLLKKPVWLALVM